MTGENIQAFKADALATLEKFGKERKDAFTKIKGIYQDLKALAVNFMTGTLKPKKTAATIRRSQSEGHITFSTKSNPTGRNRTNTSSSL